MDTILFLGVDVSESLVPRVFPHWAQTLQRDVAVEPVSLPKTASDSEFRAIAARVRSEGLLGAVITGHKARFYQAVSDDLDDLVALAHQAQEIGVLSYQNNVLKGLAIEPEVMGRYFSELLHKIVAESGSAADVMIFGAGGSTAAIILGLAEHLGQLSALIRSIKVTDIAQQRLDHVLGLATAMLPGIPSIGKLAEFSDDSFSSLSRNALLINATGLGKDFPGSPVPRSVEWPADATVMDLNYRGTLEFLSDAEHSGVSEAIDGWELFLRSWQQALEVLTGLTMNPHQRQQFREQSSLLR